MPLPHCLLNAALTRHEARQTIVKALELCSEVFVESPRNSRYWKFVYDESTHRAQLTFYPQPFVSAHIVFGNGAAAGMVRNENGNSKLRAALDYDEWTDFLGWASLVRDEYPCKEGHVWIERYKVACPSYWIPNCDGLGERRFPQDTLFELRGNTHLRVFDHTQRQSEKPTDNSWHQVIASRIDTAIECKTIIPWGLDLGATGKLQKPKRYEIVKDTIFQTTRAPLSFLLRAGVEIEVHPSRRAFRISRYPGISPNAIPDVDKDDLSHGSWVQLLRPLNQTKGGRLMQEDQGILRPLP